MIRMDSGSIIGISGLVISILGVVYSAINHKHIRTTCCGKVYDISIDIDTNDTNDSKTADKKEAIAPKEQKKEEKKEPNPFLLNTRIHKIVPHFDV
jgi:hypothetical protein